jgi:hypothetical protein
MYADAKHMWCESMPFEDLTSVIHAETARGDLCAEMRVPGKAPWLQQESVSSVLKARYRVFLHRQIALLAGEHSSLIIAA